VNLVNVKEKPQYENIEVFFWLFYITKFYWISL
jgi:hypothetical protein